jgi:hypothetical protein
MWSTINDIANILGILGAGFALAAWINTQIIKQTQKKEVERLSGSIKIELTKGGKKIELPVSIPRKELTRAEVLGRIGMIPLKNKEKNRFSLSYLNTTGFIQQLNQIINGNGDGILTISCDDDEFDQFDLSKK